MRPLAGLLSSEITGRTVCALRVADNNAIAIAIHLQIEMLVRVFIFPHMPGLECSESRRPHRIADTFRCSGFGLWCKFRRTCAAANGTGKTDATVCRCLRVVGIACLSYPQFGFYGACAWMFRVPVYVPGGRLGR